MYVQFAFALDRVKALAPQHPEWQNTEPFQVGLGTVISKTWLPAAKRRSSKLVMATHANMTTDEFAQSGHRLAGKPPSIPVFSGPTPK